MFTRQLSVVFGLFIVVMLLPLRDAYPQVIHSSSPGEQEIVLNVLDAGFEVQLPREQLLLIELKSNPSTGYAWEVVEMDNRVLRLTDTEFHLPCQEVVTFCPPLLGAPQTQVLRFAGLDAGKSKLLLAYRRPWERDIPPADTYAISVDVQGAFTGSYVPLKEQGEAFTEPPAIQQDPQILTLPATYNWCDYSICTPVKNQGNCGSCWAFGTVAPLESAIRRTDGVTRDLSEQYLVSCNTEGWGCDGGWWAHNYHHWKTPAGQAEAGSVHEADFPYTARDSPCNPPYMTHEKITGWAYIGNSYSVPSVAAIKQAIYDYGPVAAAVCVNNSFHYYGGGIFTGPSCTEINHGIVLVGWNDAGQYWILKNSWGTNWGESGYMRIRYGVSQVGYGANYIHYSSPGSIRIIRLTGDLAFGNVTVGQTATRTLTIHNDGNSSLTVSGINYPSGFSGNWSGTIAAGGSRNVTVTFAPTAAQSYNGTITVNSDKTSGTNTIGCSGTGVAQGPANDNFAAALQISGTSGQTTGANEGATKEAGEPNHADNSGGKSVWWNWTAPASGEVSFDTFGSSFDTLLACYKGNEVNSLTRIASNDDASGTLQSLITFNAVQNTVYRIAVDGYGGAWGDITLTWAKDGIRILHVSKNGQCNGLTPCFLSIQDALNAALSNSHIKVDADEYAESLVWTNQGKVTLSGGWNWLFSVQTGTTRILGIAAPLGGIIELTPAIRIVAPR